MLYRLLVALNPRLLETITRECLRIWGGPGPNVCWGPLFVAALNLWFNFSSIMPTFAMAMTGYRHTSSNSNCIYI